MVLLASNPSILHCEYTVKFICQDEVYPQPSIAIFPSLVMVKRGSVVNEMLRSIIENV